MRFVPLIITILIFINAGSAADDRVRFNRDIRPILSENCYFCHGPDDNARQSDLRFDTEQGAKEYAIVEGDSEASELFARISSEDADMVMPPPDSERSLSKDQIELIAKWIDQGAAYEGHWSFIPPERPPLPDSTDGSLHPIDQFIQIELDANDLTAAPPANRRLARARASTRAPAISCPMPATSSAA